MLLDAETMAMALPRMARAGARWRPSTALVSIGDHEVVLIDTLSLRTETIVAVDSVVVRTHGIPDDGLFHELRTRVQEVLRVGDAVAVRLADRAIFDGHVARRHLIERLAFQEVSITGALEQRFTGWMARLESALLLRPPIRALLPPAWYR